MPPTATSLSPIRAAASRSTVTPMIGCADCRFELASAVPGRSCTPARTASVAVCSVSGSGADTSTVMSLFVPKPLEAASSIVPASLTSASCDRTSACTASWSASSSVVIE
jgi:hypothetical protein